MAGIKNGPALHPTTLELAQGPNFAAITTALPGGDFQNHYIWVGIDGERLDHDARQKRDVLYSGRYRADHRPKRREGEGGEKSDHDQQQRMLDADPHERHPDHEDPDPHHHAAQHPTQRVGKRDLQVAHRADQDLVYVALALGVEDRPRRVHLRVGDKAHKRDARQNVLEIGDPLYLLDAAAERDPEDHQIK